MRITHVVSSKTVLTASAALIAISGTSYSINLYERLSLTNPSHITTADNASDSFRKSATTRCLVNPRSHTMMEDSRSITLAVPPGATVPSEEVLLSKFVTAFFGGRVFLLERVVLRLLGRQFVAFEGVFAFLRLLRTRY